MVYPLLFPRRDLGWVKGTMHSEDRGTAKRQTVTILQYYAYRLAIRETFSPIHYSGKLLQQCLVLVDAYVKTEASRMDFMRRNQTALGIEKYKGLMDHVNTASGTARESSHSAIVLFWKSTRDAAKLPGCYGNSVQVRQA